MRRRLAALVASAALLLLAGCAAVPVSGPVQTAPAPVQQDDPAFAYQPNPPVDGEGPRDVVSGFIQAEAAGGDYSVAKQFLTADFAASWRPDDRVVVHTAPWTTTTTGDDRVELRVPASARVDDKGVYTPSSQVVPLSFRLERVRGQWRIADGPKGVVLAQPAFQRVFKPALLQFFDPSYQRFVPDRRWFPQSSGQVFHTVQAMLGGPALPLVGVTRSAFPADARLAVPVSSGDGQVTVTIRTTSTPDERTTDRMQQQLAASLPSADAARLVVRLVVNGRLAPAAPQAEPEQLSATNPVGVSNGRFGALTATGSVQEDRELGPRIVALKPTAITVLTRQRLAAVLGDDGRLSIVDRRGAHVADSRPGLIAPTLDQRGWVYSVPGDSSSGLQAAIVVGQQVRVVRLEADLGGSPVRAIEVSSDGTRMLVLHDTATGPEAYVAGIERRADGTPTGLTTNRYPVALDADEAVDATWVDQSTVAVLTTSTTVQNVLVQPLGGIATTIGSPQNALQLVGASSIDDLRALLRGNAVVRRTQNGTWSLEFGASVKVSVLAVQR